MAKNVSIDIELSEESFRAINALAEELRAHRVNSQAKSVNGQRLTEPAEHFEKGVKP